MRRSAVACLAAALFSLLSSGATADEVLEVIVVTADFRERSASQLTSSISVFESEHIEALSVQHFEELVFAVPNLNWFGDGHRAR